MDSKESLRPLRPSIEGSSRDSESLLDDLEARRRKNVRTACVSCKRRKLKCSGESPCEPCHKAGISCVIDEEGDQRRKQVLKRKLDSLSERGKLLDQLVATLQATDKKRAAQILNLIRSNADLEEVQTFIDEMMERPEIEKTPELTEILGDMKSLNESQKRAMLTRPDPKRLSEIVIFHVPAYPWTTATEDSDFVSHLISLWFSWSHPFLNWIDRDLFIRDMRSGDPESEFCSEFLVNIMLADACAYSDYPEAYAVGTQPWSRGLHFYKQAKRFLDEEVERGRPTVPFIQGLGILYVCTCMMGKDRVGWVYLGQLKYAVEELAQRHKLPPPDADEKVRRSSQATTHAIWGLFNLISMTSLSYQKGGLLKVPRQKRSPLHLDAHEDIWTNYPLQSTKVESHSQCLFDAFCDVSIITHDLSWILFGDNDDEDDRRLSLRSVESTEEVYGRLRRWYKGIPACLDSTDASPHVLSFHAKYHTIALTAFGYLKDLPVNEKEDQGADWEKKTRQRAQSMCIESAREIGKLMDAYRDNWGFDRMPPVTVHWVTVSMFTLLHDMEAEASREAFVSLSVAAKGFANRWLIGKAMLRSVQLTAKQMEVQLPPETDALFIDFETKIWRRIDRASLSSQYPNFAHSMRRGESDEVEMDTFLAKFDELYVRDEESSSESEASLQDVESGEDPEGKGATENELEEIEEQESEDKESEDGESDYGEQDDETESEG